jgi:hypothetical protein
LYYLVPRSLWLRNQPERTIQDAVKALQVVIEFAEGSDGVQTTHLGALERLEQELDLLAITSLYEDEEYGGGVKSTRVRPDPTTLHFPPSGL